jgi:tRNA(fMet)-specific endonuclease VapC
MAYLLDTSVVLHATRQASKVSEAIDAQFFLRAARFRPAICEVSIGELYAFTRSQGWGERRKTLLQEQIDNTLVIPISYPGIHVRWAEMSSALRAKGETVGQNDIWIAATASVAGFTLLTTDKDFLRVRRACGLDARVLHDKTGLELI